jgi:hypothetical protein
MKQEVRLKLDVSLTIDAKHSRDDVRNILRRGIRCMFINNDKVYNSASFAEEADIYSNGDVKWESLLGERVNDPHEPRDYNDAESVVTMRDLA